MLFSKHFGKYYIKFLPYFLVGIAVLVAIDWIQLEIPRLVGGIIDELDGSQVQANIIEAITRIAIIAVIITVGRFIWRYTIFGASRRIEFQLRNVMFEHATKLSQNYYKEQKVGGMMTFFINDLEALRMSYGPGILMLVDGLTLGGFALYRMFSLDWRMTIFAAIPMALLTFAMVLIRKAMSKRFKARQQAFEELSDFTQENFSGITVIKAFVREVKEFFAFRDKNENLYNKHIGFVKYMVGINIALSIALNIVILVIVIIGSLRVINFAQTGFTGGQLTEYIAYFFTLMWPTMALSRFVQINSQAKASAERISKFLDYEIDIADHNDVVEVDELKGSIEAKGLSFKYPDGDADVLENISFSIKAGEMVGVLGRTGSGKSSLVDLLLRIYNIEKGMIFIDGHDIMDLPLKQVRETVGYVPQDNFLFSTSITENIGFAHESIDEELVHHAAKLSDIYDNVMDFKEGFETILGERGVTVSGGQKQRISIARALAKDPEVLILDDSVSAVDTKTEDAIINNLHKIRQGKTTIFIAHRISTVKKMDKIILLDHGKLSAVGSHDELMKSSELYRDMVRRQRLEKLVSGGDVA